METITLTFTKVTLNSLKEQLNHHRDNLIALLMNKELHTVPEAEPTINYSLVETEHLIKLLNNIK